MSESIDSEPGTSARQLEPGVARLGKALQVLGGLVITGCLVAGFVLLSHQTGCDQFGCTPGAHHDLTGAGWAVLIGGPIQGLVICAIGTIAVTLGEIKQAVAPAAS